MDGLVTVGSVLDIVKGAMVENLVDKIIHEGDDAVKGWMTRVAIDLERLLNRFQSQNKDILGCFIKDINQSAREQLATLRTISEQLQMSGRKGLESVERSVAQAEMSWKLYNGLPQVTSWQRSFNRDAANSGQPVHVSVSGLFPIAQETRAGLFTSAEVACPTLKVNGNTFLATSWSNQKIEFLIPGHQLTSTPPHNEGVHVLKGELVVPYTDKGYLWNVQASMTVPTYLLSLPSKAGVVEVEYNTVELVKVLGSVKRKPIEQRSDKHGGNRTKTETHSITADAGWRFEPVSNPQSAMVDTGASKGPHHFKNIGSTDERIDFEVWTEYNKMSAAGVFHGSIQAQQYRMVEQTREHKEIREAKWGEPLAIELPSNAQQVKTTITTEDGRKLELNQSDLNNELLKYELIHNKISLLINPPDNNIYAKHVLSNTESISNNSAKLWNGALP